MQKLLPTAFGSLTDPCLPDLFTTQYPAMPGVIMMGSMFCLFVIEMWLNGKTGGHSHGGPMGIETTPSFHPPPPRPVRGQTRHSFETDEVEMEKKAAQKMFEEDMRLDASLYKTDDMFLPQSEMPSWFVVFYEQYVRQRLEMMNLIKAQAAAAPPAPAYTVNEKRNTVVVTESPYIDEEGQAVDPLVYKKMNLNITLLEGGILFHSVFVGMTVSITIDGFVILLVAILFHQMFEGLGLGSRIAAVPYAKGSIRPWVLVVAFGTTAPIGQAIGLIARDSYDPNSAFGLIIVGIFNAM
jgi:solute carrier family 39 (zinc transporter), member 1/2/3